MKAAILHELGAPPELGEFPSPTAGPGQVVIDVLASAVHHVDVARASGTFYGGTPQVPSVLGSDGIGRTADGERVFFDTAVPPYGSWAEQTLVAQDNMYRPAESVDDVTAAALGNTGMAAWLALTWRARLQPGECVLVLGANGSLGTVAVQAAKALGAGRVVAVDRDPRRLERTRDRGADAVIDLNAEDLPSAMRDAVGPAGCGVIIDTLWGRPAIAAMTVAGQGARHIQLGQLAGASVELSAPLVRSRALNLMGFAAFHPPIEDRRRAYSDLTELAGRGGVVLDIDVLPLTDVTSAWNRQRQGPRAKLVLQL